MARSSVRRSSAGRSSGGAHQAMPQLAEMDRGPGISFPGSPARRQSRSMAMAAVVVAAAKTVTLSV